MRLGLTSVNGERYFNQERLKARHSSNPLILKNPHYDATILGFRIISFTCFHLLTFAHRAGSKHSRKRNMALLLQVVGYSIGAVLAQLLVQGGTPGFGGVAFDLDHVDRKSVV